jgi:hypothetical protein
MRKSLAVVLVLFVTVFLVESTEVLAQDSTPSVSSTPATTSTGKTHKKKKKKSPAPTPQPTAQATAAPTAVPSAAKVMAPAAQAASSAPKVFSDNPRLYDRVGAPGDLQKASVVAAQTLGSSMAKHDRSVFLWLGRVTNGSDNERDNSYIRFSLDGVAYAGPRKPSLVLTGTVFDQSNSGLRTGDPVQVAVDFRDIKVDYEGTKLGEVNKGSDIADQVFDILSSHPSYQWVLLAQERLNEQDAMGTPTFVVKAREGYAFLQATNSR